LDDFAFIVWFTSSEHFEQRGFARAVGTNHADTIAFANRKRDAFEELFGRE
jgi:hypothetical protein